MSDPLSDSDGPTGAGGDPALFDDGRSVFRLEYHLLLATRRRRAFFADEALRDLARVLMTAICEENGCRVESLEFTPSTVRVHVLASPYLSPHQLVAKLRRIAGPLAEAFPVVGENGGLFVRKYIASSVPTPETACDRFVDSLPTR